MASSLAGKGRLIRSFLVLRFGLAGRCMPADFSISSPESGSACFEPAMAAEHHLGHYKPIMERTVKDIVPPSGATAGWGKHNHVTSKSSRHRARKKAEGLMMVGTKQ